MLKIMNKEAPIVAYNFHKIVLNGYYEIETERINTKEKLVQWIYHLTQKKWVTPEHIKKLTEAAADLNNWKIYGNA